MSKTCQTCRFWVQRNQWAESHPCYYNPPTIDLVIKLSPEFGGFGVRPHTRAEDFCGKWERREKRSPGKS